MTDLPAPDDDSFVTTAIQGLRVPAHNPDFWDHLAWQLDDAADEMLAEGMLRTVIPRARSAAPRAAAPPAPAPVAAPAPAVRPEPVAAPEPVTALVMPVEEEHPPRQAPLQAGSARVFIDAPLAGAAAHAVDPVVHHDPAVLPVALRRRSNALLVALAAAAAVVAVMAGLTLVRQRSDAGAPVPVEVAPDGGDAAAPELLDTGARWFAGR